VGVAPSPQRRGSNSASQPVPLRIAHARRNKSHGAIRDRHHARADRAEQSAAERVASPGTGEDQGRGSLAGNPNEHVGRITVFAYDADSEVERPTRFAEQSLPLPKQLLDGRVRPSTVLLVLLFAAGADPLPARPAPARDRPEQPKRLARESRDDADRDLHRGVRNHPYIDVSGGDGDRPG
jgi:hypothetical protein